MGHRFRLVLGRWAKRREAKTTAGRAVGGKTTCRRHLGGVRAFASGPGRYKSVLWAENGACSHSPSSAELHTCSQGTLLRYLNDSGQKNLGSLLRDCQGCANRRQNGRGYLHRVLSWY